MADGKVIDLLLVGEHLDGASINRCDKGVNCAFLLERGYMVGRRSRSECRYSLHCRHLAWPRKDS